jgi:V8-like Glu-specific endopeptidase
MSTEAERVQQMRKMFERERRRQSAELRRAREAAPATELDMHRPVSSRVTASESLAFEPSFGSLGKTDAEAASGVREVIAPPVARAAPAPRAASSAKPLDAWVTSFRNTGAALESQPPVEPFVVIGTDDRIEVTNNEAYPWRCICSLQMTSPNGTSLIGTGWLVSPRLVLTAGHCVYSQDSRFGTGWMQQPMTIIPGRRGTSQPFGSATSGDYRSVVGWTENGDRDYDYGAIILPESARFGDQLGWFGYTTRADSDLEGATVNLAGYPGDKPSGTQWFHSRQLDDVADKVLTYSIDTFGGQSGAPVWQLMQDGGRYGVGIHTNGAVSGNSATRITQEVFNNIIAWVGQAP